MKLSYFKMAFGVLCRIPQFRPEFILSKIYELMNHMFNILILSNYAYRI
jgi:hypothetical protein